MIKTVNKRVFSSVREYSRLSTKVVNVSWEYLRLSTRGFSFEKYLPIAVKAVWVLSADIVPPATACPAFEGTGSYIS